MVVPDLSARTRLNAGATAVTGANVPEPTTFASRAAAAGAVR